MVDLEIIRGLQLIRNPFFDWLFYIITYVGDQYFFIVIAVVIYWTISKKFAHRFALMYMIASLFTFVLKNIFKRPRPYTEAGITVPFEYYTTGYSMPSGHATAAGVLGYAALKSKKQTGYRWLGYIAIAIMILVPFTRMYLGQHYLSDVIVGLVVGLGFAYGIDKLIDLMGDKEEWWTFILFPIVPVMMILFLDYDLYVAAGAYVGFAVGYFVEKRYVKFVVKATFWIQVLKVVGGLVIVLGIKEGLGWLFPDMLIFDFIRYLLIGVWVALGAPYVFKICMKKSLKKHSMN